MLLQKLSTESLIVRRKWMLVILGVLAFLILFFIGSAVLGHTSRQNAVLPMSALALTCSLLTFQINRVVQELKRRGEEEVR